MTVRAALPLMGAVLASGCWGGEPSQVADGEQFVVHAASGQPSAQFIRGKLPGKAPPPKGSAPTPSTMTADGGKPSTPQLAQIVEFSTSGALVAGQGGFALSGTATPNAYSVGLYLDKASTGYWVITTSQTDPQTGNLTWSGTADFGPGIQPGIHQLLGVALDEHGKAGQQIAKSVCIDSQVPDNFNSCKSSLAPPNAVITLSWDTPVDLDLQVKPPDGPLIDPKHSTGGTPNDAGVFPAGSPYIDRDANAGCVVTGAQRESLIWPTGGQTPRGTYGIYVNLFDACKQPVVHFIVEVYSVVPNPDGGAGQLKRYLRQSGELLDIQANGGSARGLFVSNFIFK